MAARIDVKDDENYLILTQTYLPSMETLRHGAPHGSKGRWFRRQREAWPFSSREEALAWVLTATARQILELSPRPTGWPPEARENGPLDTRILGPPFSPDTGRLSPLFQGQTLDTDYRVILHRSPSHFLGKQAYAPWGRIYIDLRYRKRIGIRREQIPLATKYTVIPFLEDLLAAYKVGANAVNTLLQESGHPTWSTTYDANLF